MDVEPVLNEIDEVLILDKAKTTSTGPHTYPDLQRLRSNLEEDQTVDVKQENVKIEEWNLRKRWFHRSPRIRMICSTSGSASDNGQAIRVISLPFRWIGYRTSIKWTRERPKLTKWLFRKLSKPKKYGPYHHLGWTIPANLFKILGQEKIPNVGQANGHQHLATIELHAISLLQIPARWKSYARRWFIGFRRKRSLSWGSQHGWLIFIVPIVSN